MMTRLIACLVMIATMLPAGPAVAASSSFHALGCKEDPSGDASGVDQADLVELCANFTDGANSIVAFSFDAVADFDPLGDDAWLNSSTFLALNLSIDGDDTIDRTFEITRDGDAVTGRMRDERGAVMAACDDPGETADDTQLFTQSGFLAGRFSTCFLDGADAIRFGGRIAYQQTADSSPVVDDVPDESLTPPLPDGDEPAVCANPGVVEGATVTIRRLRCGIGGTEAISQAVATSQYVFDDPDTQAIDPYQGDWAVIARDDDFADALGGSTLTFGQGPLLFTRSPASAAALGEDPSRLHPTTRAELVRVLPRGRTVYLLGGEAALHPGIDEQLEAMGYEVVRFAGAGREQTARLIATEVRRIVTDYSERFGFPDVRMALVVNSRNWPDAVLAGSIGAFWGMPILLTDAASLHSETRAAIQEMGIDYIHVVGGSAVVSTPVLRELRTLVDGRQEAGVDLANPDDPYYAFCRSAEGELVYGCRWGGSTRIETSAFVGQLNRDMLRRFGGTHPFIPADRQQFAAAINLQHPGAFTWALSTATVSGRFGGAVFIAAEGMAGDTLSDTVKFYTCPYIQDIDEILVMGDTDVLSTGFTDQLQAHHQNPTTSSFGCATAD